MKIDQLYTPTYMDIHPYNNISAYNSVNASREGLPETKIVSNTSIFDDVEFTSPRLESKTDNKLDTNAI